MLKRIGARQYYDTNPQQRHGTGDIWSGLPTHGLLRKPALAGIVITPACDLAQAKVETITYLPILPVKEWLSSPCFQMDAISAIRTEARLLDITAPFLVMDAMPPAQPGELAAFEDALANVSPSDQRLREALARCEAGTRLLRAILGATSTSPASDAQDLLGAKRWRQQLTQLVTNYRKDVHFLPADRMPSEWSIVQVHSLVLFRYPLTAPATIFDAAQDVSIHDWAAWVREAEPHIPLASAFRHVQPLKGLTLQKDFLADLLTRYAGLYLRIGSPDFTSDTIDEYIDQMEPP
jgi:hypothetical protein